MKILKKALIAFVSLIFILILIAYLLPKKVHIERSIYIKAPLTHTFNQVNDLHCWLKWSIWLSIDTTMDIHFFGNEIGEGSGYEWKSDNSKVGNGRITILESIPNDSIYIEMDFLKSRKANAYFIFNAIDSITQVKWTFEMNAGYNVFARYKGLFMDKWVGSDYEKGLTNLKILSESSNSNANIKSQKSL
jgi:hypothetical protein